MAWRVVFLPEAREELRALPMNDRRAIENVVEKLTVYGDRLGAPHSSAIRGASETLRELRPRSGRSRWRAFYRRIGDRFVVAAVGPEATVNPTGFRRAVASALSRLADLVLDPNGDCVP
jgi:hypothetical protein